MCQARGGRGEEVKQGANFKFLGLTLANSGGCAVEVEEGIKTEWRKRTEHAEWSEGEEYE